jgi:hypothetical protein
MSKQSEDLQNVDPKVPAKLSNRPGFGNQGAIKSKGRGMILEALTANKGGKTGRKALIFKILESLDRDLDSLDPAIYGPARSEALKLALAMTKDDKAGGLDELLKGAANVQINFNNHFSQRSGSNQANPAGHSLTIESQNGVSIGFTPPPGSGEAGPVHG